MTDESNPPNPEPDPATIWWGPDQTDRPRAHARPPYVPSFQRRREERWRWRYSWMFGVMYGPIPVGIIIGIPVLIALWR